MPLKPCLGVMLQEKVMLKKALIYSVVLLTIYIYCFFPVLNFKFNKNFHKIELWITQDLLASRKTKLQFSNKMNINPSFENRMNFKRLKTFITSY